MRVDPFAPNNFGVEVTPLDWDDEFAPLSKTYHGLTIATGDQIIGRITSWNPQPYTREVAQQFELSHITYGRVVDQVPGRSTSYTVSGTSAEMWDLEIERRLTGDSQLIFNDLSDQIRSFEVFEHWFRGASIYRTWVYQGCWLTERNEDAFTAEGDARVMANFAFQFVSRKLIFGE
jgi:hypothetical protein